MKRKYNLALIPLSKSKEFVDVAEKFSNIADKYLLGNNSHPHITLYQFEADENQIDNIWRKACDEWNHKLINLELATFSYITFDKDTYWISLLPKDSDILHEMHSIIAGILQLPTKQNYDPHLTLINTKNAVQKDEIEHLSKSFIPIVDSFKLAVGKSDNIGQFIDVIYRIDLIEQKTYKL